MRAGRGFTLIELMVVVTILATALLLVPPNLYAFGARSRLENVGNTLVAVIGAARAQAILDGYPVYLEFGSFKDDDGKEQQGYRWIITSQPAQRSDELLGAERARDPKTADQEDPQDRKSKEREWLATEWNPFTRGVKLVGFSEKGDNWQRVRDDRPYRVGFSPDGAVEKWFAIRVMSEDLDVREEDRSLTVVVNGLTGEAASYDGYREVPPQRDEHDFVR